MSVPPIRNRTSAAQRNRLFATAALLGLVAFLVQGAEILDHHTSFTDFAAPAAWGEIVRAGIAGLVAFGAALGVNVRELTAGLKNQPKEE